MKEGIYKYTDGLKKFMIEGLQKIDYLKDIDEDALHDILYNCTARRHEKG